MQADEYSAADAARQRLAPKSRFRLLSSLSDLRQRAKSTKSKRNDAGDHSDDASGSSDELAQMRPSTGTAHTVIDLDDSAISEIHENRDSYRWAILYENQRGYASHVCPSNFLQFLI